MPNSNPEDRSARIEYGTFKRGDLQLVSGRKLLELFGTLSRSERAHRALSFSTVDGNIGGALRLDRQFIEVTVSLAATLSDRLAHIVQYLDSKGVKVLQQQELG